MKFPILWLPLGIALLYLPTSAKADAPNCDDSIPGVPGLPYITCTKLSPALLLSLEYASKSEVQKVMEVPGRPSDDDGSGLNFDDDWHGGADGYSGSVNFSFSADGKVSIISAIIDPPNTGQNDPGPEQDYIWNAAGSFCSDLPMSNHRCNDPDENPFYSPAFEAQMDKTLDDVNQ